MAIAGLPAVVDRPAPLLVGEPHLVLVGNDDFAARKDAYVGSTRGEMAEWRDKIRAGTTRTEAEGGAVSANTKAHLDAAWATTERGWRKLQVQSAEGWDKAKAAYERSTAELRLQWHRAHPEDKD